MRDSVTPKIPLSPEFEAYRRAMSAAKQDAIESHGGNGIYELGTMPHRFFLERLKVHREEHPSNVTNTVYPTWVTEGMFYVQQTLPTQG